MATLTFDLPEVLRLCAHATSCTDWSTGYSFFENDDMRMPGLLLVRDHGVYLMSNGKPGLMKEDGGGHVVVYAEGMNPDVDEFDDWWERKRAAFGGDDGVDCLPWAVSILRAAKACPQATKLQIEISGDKLELVGVV